ncbi:MAG: hypothetical protein OQK46_02665 [Gammaproteobacteria bacterium]|nr:hypothetical protein [Gammaproteobacteria bacterium]
MFMDKEKVVYVGETGLLQGRMNDVRNTRNHTLRRSIGERKFSKHSHYTKATSSLKYAEDIEILVNKYIESLIVSILPVNLGRSELEEYLVSKYDPVYNKRKKRV